MMRSKRASKRKYEESDDDAKESDSSGSDYDPDETMVPGGGKSVLTLAQTASNRDGEIKSEIKKEDFPSFKTEPGTEASFSAGMFNPLKREYEDDPGAKLLASGLVTKSNSQPGYQVISNPLQPMGNPLLGIPFSNYLQSSYNPYFQSGFDPRKGFPFPILNEFANSLYPGISPQNYFANLMGYPGYPSFQGYNTGGMPGMAPSHIPLPKLWMNQDIKGKDLLADEGAGEDDDEEEMGHTETFADYMPSKLKLGRRHPDPVVETSSLASIESPDITYQLHLGDDIINQCKLSALQLEAITYACQQHENFLPDGSRAGFLIGDGAGVGKGRTLAGIIYENWLQGRKKAVWVSVSNDLKYDSERDLSDIGASKIDVYPLNKMKYAKINSPINNNVKKGVVYSTYSSLIGESQGGGKYKTRLKQLLQWCGDDFDGLIIFDECHRAKNLCPVGSGKPTKTGLTVVELQNKLPKARVIYASATGASEPRNMAYMIRLGIWGVGTPFREFNDFISSVEKRGVGAMEIVAMDMKLRGSYIARQLSFQGVSFKVDEVPLSEDFKQMYDKSVALWVKAKELFQQAAGLIDAEQRMRKTMWGQFWSSHQRFFKYLCIAAKVRHVVNITREAIKCGKCVVIGLQSTGEARTLEQVEKEDELTDFVSTAKGVLETLVEKHFPAPDRNRIARLLGIGKAKTVLDTLTDHPNSSCSSGSSGVKRKPVRQAKTQAFKRYKSLMGHSDESESDSDVNEDREPENHEGQASDSDFQLSNEESQSSGDEESGVSEGSDASDNPFEESSDVDDPWVTKKKAKKPKPKKKKDKFVKLLKQQKKKSNGTLPTPSKDCVEKACELKDKLVKCIENYGDKLPPNTLDQLIDEFGGPDNVAEMTGRKGRVIQLEDGTVQYESRSEIDVPLETLNITEKQRFMDGEKDIAIISEAASSGISLQSDRRAKNQRRRVHITLELPWSADRAIQQFGRTHRSNQVNAPEYVFLISDLAGERRFASIVAKRLESLGALTHGDRRATETRDLSRFNIDNKYGRAALESTMKSIMGYETPMVPSPEDYKGDFFADVQNALCGVGIVSCSENFPEVKVLDKDFNNMSKFLNRILGMPVELQNRLFQYFTDTLGAIVSQAKKTGRYDLGILDLGTAGDKVKRIKMKVWVAKHATGDAKTELHRVQVQRGMSWTEAKDKYEELDGDDEGFYLSHQVRNNKLTAVLAVQNDTAKVKDKNERSFAIYRPNTGLQVRLSSFAELQKKHKKVTLEEVEKHWTDQFVASENTCSHAYWKGNCRRITLGLDCDVGLRTRTYHILAGSVLNIWTKVEQVLSSSVNTSQNAKMQVVRLKMEDGHKIVGSLIPNNCVEELEAMLTECATNTYENTF